MTEHPFCVEALARVHCYLDDHPDDPDAASHVISALARLAAEDLIAMDVLVDEMSDTWNVPPRVHACVQLARLVARSLYGSEERRLVKEASWL